MSVAYFNSAVYTLDQLEQLGQVLAYRHKPHKKTGGNSLLSRLQQNEDLLRTTHKLVTASVQQGNKPTPAGEWLLDNFHLIEEQIRTSKLHLPRSFCRELPTVEDPNWKKQPRIYLLARELINHTDGRLDADATTRIVGAYQKKAPLRLGELWAFPIMLRLGLIDNLRSISESIAAIQIDQVNAKFWAERIASARSEGPQGLISVVTELSQSEPRLSSAFVSEFTRRLQISSDSPSLAMSWIEQQVGALGSSVENHQNLASQDQAHDQMSMSNSIASLRFLNETDWRDFVENMSFVNTVLMQDPSQVFPLMDFATRDSYRHVVESIARQSKYNELQVAQAAVDLAKERFAHSKDDTLAHHVGDYLLGRSRTSFEKKMSVKRRIPDRFRFLLNEFPLAYYFGLLILIIAALVAVPYRLAWNASDAIPVFGIIALLILFPATQCGLSLVNWLTSMIVKPKVWPRMDFSKGIPDDSRTLVVIPCMLSSLKTIEELIGDLEVRFLGNRDENILFGLLSDFADSPLEVDEADSELLNFANQGILALNRKYTTADRAEPFYLFHRTRQWNPGEGMWMGYERKRGKLSQLNEFIRSVDKGYFKNPLGDLSRLKKVRYVLTLDADSTLPRETACTLIETMSHPMNHPRLDVRSGLVKTGYAILQPRVTIHLKDSKASHFSRVFSDGYGIDPYTKSVSDVYQDLFHEGTFIGKGIYDIDAFESAIKSRFPENRILSHDLIESSFARSGLVSDVQLVEEYPTTFSTDASRRHRWIRGDWQIASWMLPRIPDGHGKKGVNPLSHLARWKIFDNLRRSMTPIATLLLFLFSWSVDLTFSLAMTGTLLSYLALPHVLNALNLPAKFSNNLAFRQIMRDEVHQLGRALVVSVLNVVFLPYEAYLTMNASLKSVYRLLVSKRKLLEWRSSADDVKVGTESHAIYLRLMWFAPVAAFAGLVIAASSMRYNAFVAFPIVFSWFFAPTIAWWMSRPLLAQGAPLTRTQDDFLRALSRKTWLFFETFVTAADNWLPPDNFQEFPAEVIAHRTSPTNIGLSLLSGLGAYDFGYISIKSLIYKTEQTFDSLDKLERYKGHFYNWYDTETREPLNPHYVSTVDSGNLQGALLVLRQGFLELADGDLLSQRISAGVEDGLLILKADFWNALDIGPVLKKRLPEITLLLDQHKRSGIASTKEVLEWLLVVRMNFVQMGQEISGFPENECSAWIRRIVAQVDDHRDHLQSLTAPVGTDLRVRLRALSARATSMMKLDYSFLYNKSNKLLAIGYHVGDSRLDQSYYDLLASEARLASFLAIADGSLPQEHWFALGRQLTYSGNVSTLLSWSGSMFEYLMPLLIMPSYEGTLLEQACRQCIHSQIRYGRDRKVPWGISESAYNLTDSRYNYQYRAFGVPSLGFKRGLEQDLVIAPYATVMSLMLEPHASCINLQEMAANGYTGKYGFYEAIDFTSSRVPAGEERALIRSFMVHHQGMSFLSLLHHLLKQPMQARMANDPSFKATELLLHERVPKMTALFSEVKIAKDVVYSEQVFEESFRIVKNPSRYNPEVHLLGNENFHVVLTSAGSGYSSWKGLMLTRWREDRTKDAFGYFFYIKDQKTSDTWSAGFQPTLKKSAQYEAIFSEGRGEIRRSENGLDTHLEVAVSPDDDAELRRLTLFNHSSETKVLEITSYAEVVLAPIGADMAHPAFSNLFIESELVGNQQGILCRRRGRDPQQINPWLYHNMCVHGGVSSHEGIETDRAKFIGRNREMIHPLALERALTNSAGAVLDPIISMRKRITLAPGETAIVDSILGIHMDRSAALIHMERFGQKSLADRILELAWTHGHVLLQQINCSAAEALLYGKLASSLIYGGSKLRAQSALLKANQRPLSAFWSYGISGDHPIVLLRLFSQHSLAILQQVVRGHDYWRRKGLTVDLIIWNEDRSGYRQDLNERIFEVINATGSNALLDKHGGIFVRRPDQMSDEDKIIFQAAARVILSDQNGTLEEQINSARSSAAALPKNRPGHSIGRRLGFVSSPADLNVKSHEVLLSDNGIGGFRQDGKEYVMRLGAQQRTPLPWVNVLANADFGSLVSESGSTYTWSENAHEHRLTPWFNDPVSDPSGEAIFIRDENSGDFWSSTPSPCPGRSDYEVRHGFGYSTFSTETQGIDSIMTTFVAAKDPVKILWISLSNRSNRARNLSLTAYFEIVLGEHRSKSANQIVTEHDSTQGILYARNIFAADFRDRTAFLSSSVPAVSFSGDRGEFIGRNRSLSHPAAMDRVGLSGQVGVLYDPCLAMQVSCELAPGETKEIAFVFGAGSDLAHIRRLSRAFRSLPQIHVALDNVHQKWARLLGRISVETPDSSLNILSNGWLLYQTISSRIWGRSGFYQSGGAYGFRDQLQDMMAVVYSAPEIVREHIIRSSSRQFYEGDVQHWWHPPQGRGVRTKISDDYLWLPFVTDHYIKVTGDRSILDETARYLSAKALEDGVESEYSLPLITEEQGSIYEHCVKALEYGMKYGSHGLPLMGSGDWNDGMNHVGIEGKGESVWLGFFLLDTLNKFSKIADARKDVEFASTCRQHSTELREKIASHAWDGAWYLRAYCDDGSKLGSAENQECRIDSLPQSWSVLSGGATGSRAEEGMKAVYEQLVKEDLGIIKLFDPPFDKQLPNPGYISGYLPGVRENGGQYTHAAIWVVMAAAQIGDFDRAMAMLRLINPILHSESPDAAARYQIEPYVLAGDVYAAHAHGGRGGWSWYTGSAAWFYRAIVETFIGFDLQGDSVLFTPRLPSTWPELRFEFWYLETLYKVWIRRDGITRSLPLATMDGVVFENRLPLVDDRKGHAIEIVV